MTCLVKKVKLADVGGKWLVKLTDVRGAVAKMSSDVTVFELRIAVKLCSFS